jgi:hypothetical protein
MNWRAPSGRRMRDTPRSAPEATQALVQAANQPPPPGHDLTERERVVLALMVEGLNNTQIAARLVVSPSTIKTHVSQYPIQAGRRQPVRSCSAGITQRIGCLKATCISPVSFTLKVRLNSPNTSRQSSHKISIQDDRSTCAGMDHSFMSS